MSAFLSSPWRETNTVLGTVMERLREDPEGTPKGTEEGPKGTVVLEGGCGMIVTIELTGLLGGTGPEGPVTPTVSTGICSSVVTCPCVLSTGFLLAADNVPTLLSFTVTLLLNEIPHLLQCFIFPLFEFSF